MRWIWSHYQWNQKQQNRKIYKKNLVKWTVDDRKLRREEILRGWWIIFSDRYSAEYFYVSRARSQFFARETQRWNLNFYQTFILTSLQTKIFPRRMKFKQKLELWSALVAVFGSWSLVTGLVSIVAMFWSLVIITVSIVVVAIVALLAISIITSIVIMWPVSIVLEAPPATMAPTMPSTILVERVYDWRRLRFLFAKLRENFVVVGEPKLELLLELLHQWDFCWIQRRPVAVIVVTRKI